MILISDYEEDSEGFGGFRIIDLECLFENVEISSNKIIYHQSMLGSLPDELLQNVSTDVRAPQYGPHKGFVLLLQENRYLAQDELRKKVWRQTDMCTSN